MQDVEEDRVRLGSWCSDGDDDDFWLAFSVTTMVIMTTTTTMVVMVDLVKTMSVSVITIDKNLTRRCE